MIRFPRLICWLLLGCLASLVFACAEDALSPDLLTPDHHSLNTNYSVEASIPALSSAAPLRAPNMRQRLEPVQIDSIPRGVTPLLPEEIESGQYEWLRSTRLPDDDEEDGGLPTDDIDVPFDQFEFSPLTESSVSSSRSQMMTSYVVAQVNWSWIFVWLTLDQDGDCLPNGEELSLGTDVSNPDTDGDGWFDGPCNERRRLVLTYIKAHDEQEDVGDDEFYLISDDIRIPNNRRDLDAYWDYNHGTWHSYDLVMAERVRGTNTIGYLRNLRIEGWEDDVEAWETWTVDDLLFWFNVNMGAYADGETFTIREEHSDWDYEFRFRMEIESFADPTPLADGDFDQDGILDSAEFAVNEDFGGICDPYRRDVLVEVDWMSGHGMNTESKRMVMTQYYRYGYDLFIFRDDRISSDGCLTRDEARNIYNSQFSFASYDAFRYAVIGEELWNDASGVALGDTFFVDDSTWWINGGVLAQAGTFIHELGHTMSLTQANTYYQIDTIGSISYDSCMNYLYQPWKVDYSNDGAGGTSNDHDDWEDIDPTYGLKYSFGLSTYSDDGQCG